MEFVMKVSGRVFLVVVLLCVFAGVVPSWAQFETRATSPFPEGGFSIATGDFNHDGKLDVVMITDNGFSVALGNGDGTFGKAVTYSTKLSYSLAIADFNGDGNLDVVTADEDSSPSTVSVYLGNGDGTFHTTPIISNTTSYNEFIVACDFNGDGKTDIVVIENPHISVLLGNGDGTFGPPSDNDSMVGAKWLAVADFDNDHKLDVLVTAQFGTTYSIGILLGNGDGTLQDVILQPTDFVPATVAVGDLNHDGKMDAVLAYDLGGIGVFLGNGDGTLRPAVNYNTTGISGEEVVVGDLNHDGRLDVAIDVASTIESGMDVLWGNGDGTLQDAQYFGAGKTGLVAVGDVNGDRLPDFIMGSSAFGAVTMLNTGVVSFSPTTPLTFLTQLINTKSPAQTVTLTNSGKSRLSISSIKVSGPFKASNTCGSSLAPGAKCTISALFQPTTTGSLGGLITLTDGASSKPQYIELLGAGTSIKFSPGSLSFGAQKVGSQSQPQVVTATNIGATTVQVKSLTIGGPDNNDFSMTDSCTGQMLQPGGSCTATIIFSPTETGTRSGVVNFIQKNQPAADPQPLSLTGTGD
jgi:hypothetical protein